MLWFLSCKPKTGEIKSLLPQIINSPFPSTAPDVPVRWDIQSLQNTPLSLGLSNSIENFFNSSDLDKNGYTPTEVLAKKWNDQLLEFNFFKLPMNRIKDLQYSSLDDYYDDTMGIYFSDSWFSSLSASTLAITQFFGFRQNKGLAGEYLELVHADIIINSRDHLFADDGHPFSFDLRSVLLHEMGHLLGLPHQFEKNAQTVMSPSILPSEQKRNLFANDRNQLQKLYPTSSLDLGQNATSISVLKKTSPIYQLDELEKFIVEIRLPQ